MKSNRYKFILFLFLLLVQFWGLTIINSHAFYYFFVPILLFFFCKKYNSVYLYKKELLLFLAFIICSCIYSAIYNGQNLVKTFVASLDFFGIISLFILVYYKVPLKECKKLLVTISLLFCVCYIIQWIIYPTVLFSGATDETNISGSYFRMRMQGSICAYILYFYGLNELLLTKKIKNIIYMIVGGIPIIVMGFRSLTALTLICSMMLFLFLSAKSKKTIVLLNKIDLDQAIDETAIEEFVGKDNIIKISALKNEGIEQIHDKIESMVFAGDVKSSSNLVITNSRHKDALFKAYNSINDAIDGIEQRLPYDFIEVDFKNIWDYLGYINGDTVQEDLLDTIFSNFCIGK